MRASWRTAASYLARRRAAAFLRQNVGNQEQAVLDVVEGDEVGKVHEGRVVHVNVHLDAGRKALQPAHRFVSKKAHGAGSEWRQAGQGHGAVTRALMTQAIEDVTGFFRPARAPDDGNSIAARRNHLETGQRRKKCSAPPARRLPRSPAESCRDAPCREARDGPARQRSQGKVSSKRKPGSAGPQQSSGKPAQRFPWRARRWNSAKVGSMSGIEEVFSPQFSVVS